jgi:proline iminopeptidase
MNKLRFISILISIGFLGMLCALFIPREYDIEHFIERKGTEYWNLKTGSKIGYTRIESNQQIKRNPIIYLHGGPGGKITNQIIDH